MEQTHLGKKYLRWIAALIAVFFGLATIKAGGQVLFGSEEARIAAGHYIPFVLWFNFSAGFLYVIAGIGIAMQKQWSVVLALFILVSTAFVFAAFGISVFFAGIDYESRTVGAMTFRTVVWALLFTMTYKQFHGLKQKTHNQSTHNFE